MKKITNRKYLLHLLVFSYLFTSAYSLIGESINQSKIKESPIFAGARNIIILAQSTNHAHLSRTDNYQKKTFKENFFSLILIAMSHLKNALQLPQKNDREYKQALMSMANVDDCRLSGLAGIFDPKICDAIRALRMSGFNPIPFQNAILFYGPPGTGKTTIAEAIAKAAGAEFISCSAASLQNKWTGGSAENIRNLFAGAIEKINRGKTVVLFVDEIDAFSRQRSQSDATVYTGEMLTEFLTKVSDNKNNPRLLIIVATNVAEVLDSALKSRFIQIKVPTPDKEMCEKLFKHYLTMYQHKLEDIIPIFAQYAFDAQLSARDIENIVKLASAVGQRRGSTEISENEIWAEIKAKANDRLIERQHHEQMVKDILAQRELILVQLTAAKQERDIRNLNAELLRLQILWYRTQLERSTNNHNENSSPTNNRWSEYEKMIFERGFDDNL